MKTISDVKLSYLVKKLLGKIKDSNDELTTKISSVEQQSKDNKDDIATLRADTASMTLEEVLWEDESMLTKECSEDYVSNPIDIPRKIGEYDKLRILCFSNIEYSPAASIYWYEVYPEFFTKGGQLYDGIAGTCFPYIASVIPVTVSSSTGWKVLYTDIFREVRIMCDNLDDKWFNVWASDCKDADGNVRNRLLIPFKVIGYRKVTATE